MKKFVVNCDFGGQMSPFAVYIGDPEPSKHPLQNQSHWLSQNRGGVIPNEFMDAVGKLKDLASQHNISLEDLCVFALGSAQQNQVGAMNKDQSSLKDSEEDDELYEDLEDMVLADDSAKE